MDGSAQHKRLGDGFYEQRQVLDQIAQLTTGTTRTRDDTVRGSTLSGTAGVHLQAGHDVTLTAAQLGAEQGAITLAAGHDVTLAAATENHSWSEDTRTHRSGLLSSKTTTTHDATQDQRAIGTTLGGASVAIAAGHDLTTQGAQLLAEGDIGLSAGHDVLLGAAYDTHSEQHERSTVKRGGGLGVLTGTSKGDLFTRTHKVQHDASGDTTAVGSLVSGDHVTIAAGHDLTTQASQVAGTHDVVLAAGHDLTLGTADSTHSEDHSLKVNTYGAQRSGLHGMFGVAKARQTGTETDITPTGSLVGSTDGSVTLSAGQDVRITGSDVLSQTGTAIVGQNVTIEAAVGTVDGHQTQSLHTGGIMAGLSGGAATAAEQVWASGQGASRASDKRLKALYAAQAGYAAHDAYAGISDGIGGAQGQAVGGNIARDGNGQPVAAASGAQGAANASGTSLRIGIGASSASAHSDTHDDIAYASHIRSAGDITVAATNGDLNVIGSQIAGQNVALAASHDLNLLSQAEQHSQKDASANAGGEVGVSLGSTTGIYLSVNGGKGRAHGNGTTHAQTSVGASDTLSLIAGHDATLQGAQARGQTLLADIGHDLTLTSEQDTDDYASNYWQGGVTFVYGFSGGGAGVSGNLSLGQTDSTYASVTQTTGLAAGEGGYQIHVGGNTDLTGAVIASTADAGKNLLDTGTLNYSDIENQAKYDAWNVSVSGGYGSGGGSFHPGGSIPQNDSDSSTTKAGIAQGTIEVRNGSTDLSGLDRSPDIDAEGLKPIFDQQKVAEQQEMGQVAGQVGMRTAGTIADYMADHATTTEEQKAWSDGGANKALLHGLVGAATAALGGGDALQGALGAGAGEAASAKMQEYLWSQGINPDSSEGKALMELASAAIGGVVGGGAGAVTALQGEQYNRQLHPDETAWIKQHAEAFARQQCGGCTPSREQIDQATATLTQQALKDVDLLWRSTLSEGDDQAAQAFLASAYGTFTNETGAQQSLFTSEGNQYLRPALYADVADRGFYQAYAQPGVTRTPGRGLAQEGADTALALQQGLLTDPLWPQRVEQGLLQSLETLGEHPVTAVKGWFQQGGGTLGENAAAWGGAGAANLNALYGQDVTAAQRTLESINSALVLGDAAGAGKIAGELTEQVMKGAMTTATKAAIAAGDATNAARVALKQSLNKVWNSDAASLDRFIQSITGNVGAVNGFKNADALNALMDKYNWSPAWMSGTQVADVTLKPGTTMNMVVSADTYSKMLEGDTSRLFGGWGTFDDIPSQAYVRNELAITSQMKSDVSYVIKVEVTQPVNAKIGIVGDQPGAGGGGNQLHFNLPPEQRGRVLEVIGAERLNP